jgi:hypothetical protein
MQHKTDENRVATFSAARLGRAPLLTIDANGMRYGIERDRVTGALWFTTREPGIGIHADALDSFGGASTGRVPSVGVRGGRMD